MPEREDIRKLAKDIFIERERGRINSKYGEFIVQTNEVHFWLSLLILTRSHIPNKKFLDYLLSLTLGSLIGHFRVCAKNNIPETNLLGYLDKYKKYRDRLAHKMISPKKLTEKECNQAIKLGKKLWAELNALAKKEVGRKS